MGSRTKKIIKEHFESLSQNCQKDLEESIRGSEFVYDSIDSSYYHLDKISLGRKGRLYIDSLKWFKNKKSTINPKSNDDK